MNLNAFSPSREGLRFYVDNIFVGVGGTNIQKMPCITLQYYYSEIFDENSIPQTRMVQYFLIERTGEFFTQGLHIRTRKAQDGYLFVNRKIADKIESLDVDLEKLKIIYVYNSQVVSTKDEVNQLLALRKENIQISEIVYDEHSKTLSVYIIEN